MVEVPERQLSRTWLRLVLRTRGRVCRRWFCGVVLSGFRTPPRTMSLALSFDLSEDSTFVIHDFVFAESANSFTFSLCEILGRIDGSSIVLALSLVSHVSLVQGTCLVRGSLSCNLPFFFWQRWNCQRESAAGRAHREYFPSLAWWPHHALRSLPVCAKSAVLTERGCMVHCVGNWSSAGGWFSSQRPGSGHRRRQWRTALIAKQKCALHVTASSNEEFFHAAQYLE